MRAILSSRLTSKLRAGVTSASDLDAALTILANEPIDVVVMDVNVAGRSAVDVLPMVRALAPRARVVLMSAEVSTQVVQRALAAGADQFVAKSAGLDVLCGAADPGGRYHV